MILLLQACVLDAIKGDTASGENGETGETACCYGCDADADGYCMSDGDCDDADPAVNPGTDETCNGVDDDCDGVIDNDCDAVIDEGVVLYADADGDGYGDPASTSCSASPGWVTNASDCNDADSLAWTGASEICDGVDNDCNGTIDDGLTVAWYLDADGDGYGNPSIVVYACAPPGAAYVTDGTDPDDADPSVP